MATIVETGRLRLREWEAADVAPYAEMCASPRVMEFLDGPLTIERCAASVAGRQEDQARHGHCFWAMERRDDRRLLGFCGLERCDDPGTPVSDDVEIGWRLAEHAWGRGYATEAATTALEWGWRNLAVPRIVALTVPANRRSWTLMQRLDMERRPDLDFSHPLFAPDHPLHAHVVYAAERPL